jgi:hypothetical protein
MIGEGYNQICLIDLTTNRCPIFAVQSHVKDASPELLNHVGLQLQAFDHPRFDTAVVVAYGQQARSALRTE